MKIDRTFILFNIVSMVLTGAVSYLIVDTEFAIRNMLGWCVGAAAGYVYGWLRN